MVKTYRNIGVIWVADMMDLRDFETRRLVDKGLGQIRNLYFKGMIAKQEYQLKD